MRALATRADAQLVAATDNNAQGEAFAAPAARYRCRSLRGDRFRTDLRSPEVDWNDALKAKQSKEMERGGRTRSGCRMPAGRVKGEASPGCAGP